MMNTMGKIVNKTQHKLTVGSLKWNVAIIRMFADCWTEFKTYKDDDIDRIVLEIRDKFDPYLYSDNPPQEIIDELLPKAKGLYDKIKEKGFVDILIRMYFPIDNI
jgi:hypothetical protein